MSIDKSLRIQDTLSGDRVVFEPLNEGQVKMYVCGVTPYDRCHLGHARCYIAWDVVYRYFGYLGYEVTYCRNFTDIDDKIIKRANERGIAPTELAQENIDAFYGDMDALGIARPQHEPRVSETIPEIIALVKTLEDKGIAYAVDGDVYYAIEKFPEYGKLSGRKQEDMQAGARVSIDTKKRHPMDFALWKAAKPGEPEWESPWGMGRPGWHIECSAMSTKFLGQTFDVHAGGRDLIFPHHENEIAQSEGASGTQYARHWLHNGFVNINKEKMSKSLGNQFNVADLFERYVPEVLRFFMISATTYRNPINFTDAQMDEAAARMAYFYETLRKLDTWLDVDEAAFNEGDLPHAALIANLEARFREAMNDDFNTVRALDPISETFRALNELMSLKKKKQKASAREAGRQLLAILKQIDSVFNLFGADPVEYLTRHRAKATKRLGLDEAYIEQRILDRIAARQEKDWAAADEVRIELAAKGVVLMDHPAGTDWMVNDLPAEAET